MKTRLIAASIPATALALTVGQMTAVAVPGRGGSSPLLAGPDVIVGAIPDVVKYGANTVNGVNIMAYAFGSTSCNIGSVNLRWWQNTPYHPVIPQNAYRIKNGRIEQIGMAWMKHGFCALQESLCSVCQPGGIGCGSATSELGVGCSDPYTASLNGSQGDLGPRFEANPTTGAFPATGSTTWPAAPAGQSTIARRLQIRADDLNPTLNSGAVYLAECQYVHPDDAASNNDNNNASYRQFTVGSLSGGAYNVTLAGQTFQMKPAIYHWPVIVPTATVTPTDGPDGRYVVGCNVTRNANGTWHYEYAVMNLNSDAAAASFSVRIPGVAPVTGAGFKDISYHSGEPYDGTDWAFSVQDGFARWQCAQSFAQNPNANALRWGTMYNFWFDCSAAPGPGSTIVGLFKTGETVFAASKVPYGPCATADLDCSGAVDGGDLGLMLAGWGTCGNPCPADFDQSGTVDGADLGILLSNWG